MCGRFILAADLDDLQARFGFEAGALTYGPRYNIAPTQEALVITKAPARIAADSPTNNPANNIEGRRRAEMMRWGLVPSWAKDISLGSRMINARGETLAEKPAFRAAYRKRRCIIPADGFYEWKREGKRKVPMYVFLKSRRPFAFAGLWESWRSPSGETIRSCAIVTTSPNSFMEPIHNRMPVMLSQEAEGLWLDPLVEDPGVLGQLLTPFPAEAMDAYPVSTLVNSPANQGPECIAPAETQHPIGLI